MVARIMIATTIMSGDETIRPTEAATTSRRRFTITFTLQCRPRFGLTDPFELEHSPTTIFSSSGNGSI